MMDLSKLKTPFSPDDIEWRIAERGKKGDGQWAKVLAYVTNRAIMDRLDEVCGPENWKNQFEHIQGAFLCGLSIRVGDEWVTKWDGAQESQIEATKGGISGAMKRAAVQWGIGRYLYDLDSGWANIHANGQHYAGKFDKTDRSGKVLWSLEPMKWDPPLLPDWAVPTNTPKALVAESKEKQPVTVKTEPQQPVKPDPKQAQRELYKTIESAIDGAIGMTDLDSLAAKYDAEIKTLPKAGQDALYAKIDETRADMAKAAFK